MLADMSVITLILVDGLDVPELKVQYFSPVIRPKGKLQVP